MTLLLHGKLLFREPIPWGQADQYSLSCILGYPLCIVWFTPQGLEIDPQLFGLLVEVAALQAQSLRRLRDVMMAPL